VFFVGEFELRQAQLDLLLAPARQANHLLPAWPATATILARVWLLDAIVGRNEADYRLARSWRVAALHRDDTDPGLWNDLAEFDEGRGLTDDASVEYESALRFNPTSVLAMDGLARLAWVRCDVDQERYWTQRALRVAPPAALSPPSVPVCVGK
jgi:hypothetical protein